MEQYCNEQPDSEQQGLQQSVTYKYSKKIISRSFFAVFILATVVFLAQNAIFILVNRLKPEIAEADWYVWALTAVSLIGIGFPVYYLIMRTIPDSPKKGINKMKPSEFIVFFFICTAAMYITNFLTQFITIFISIIKGGELVNPAAEAIMNQNYIISLIYAAVLAPLIEEIIFRKILLNKLRRFGDIPAILMTGLAFGLFHFNLMQFFYAAVLGFLFAYITIRTNTIRYSIILHMMINSVGTIFVPFVKDMNLFVMMMITAWVFTAVTIGVVFFILNIRKIRLEKAEQPVRAKAFILNLGVILFIIISIALFIVNTVGI